MWLPAYRGLGGYQGVERFSSLWEMEEGERTRKNIPNFFALSYLWHQKPPSQGIYKNVSNVAEKQSFLIYSRFFFQLPCQPNFRSHSNADFEKEIRVWFSHTFIAERSMFFSALIFCRNFSQRVRKKRIEMTEKTVRETSHFLPDQWAQEIRWTQFSFLFPVVAKTTTRSLPKDPCPRLSSSLGFHGEKNFFTSCLKTYE